ncbi:1,4-alpha-glucan branching protein GlgB [Peribacillus kribbensis]|uniref:1,4-alpha-glucan branching protein GlgB n=1 Tax=Peribacillus kribbensis TaxID=356658 RepID=UPI0004089947|nr:1,4-alpha-glucan branching protein GlgB [Peribacillus kribbensis]
MSVSAPLDYSLHLFHEGNLFEAYKLFGAHLFHENGAVKTRFCVWAPHAKMVRISGQFNSWNGHGFEMERVNDEGVWVKVIEENLSGQMYKYEIETHEGSIFLKADPYAFQSELRPGTASIVRDLSGYQWEDGSWQKKRARNTSFNKPVFIYEMHFGSWKRKEDGSFFSYVEMAEELIPYLKEHGFTHVELLPMVEHPFDGSWGYQGTGYYSATSRYGSPQDFMYFIDHCHQNDIGVVLDWVPGHFVKDAHGLYHFDGQPLYEYPTEKHRENKVWGTANFDLGKNEIHSFLISNAHFWMEYFHIDGFRMDAVANIIYWPGGSEKETNEYGVHFLRKLNSFVHELDPNFLMIAEDSSDYPQVTAPAAYGGLGFSYKWNMGWMNDMLLYMKSAPEQRPDLHGKVTFSIMYAFSEQFLLPFSHDEVVHGKKSLLDKMPGSYEEKFAQLRLLYGFMFAHPGKKLLFMGGEFGHFSEWDVWKQLDWVLFDYDMHVRMDAYVKELAAFYKRQKALYELDFVSEGFEWIDANNTRQSIFSFIRKAESEDESLIVVCNFSRTSYENYLIGVPGAGEYREVFNSDDQMYGGSHFINKKKVTAEKGIYHGKPYSIDVCIPGFGITIFKKIKKRKGKNTDGEKKVRSNASSRRPRKQAE